LHATARCCTKVERQISKSEAALLLERRIGEHFDAVVTGNTMVGIWVRIFAPPAEGKLVNRNVELAVGERVRVRLVSTDVERGFIDFQYLGL
jgi:exoribonuclease-2